MCQPWMTVLCAGVLDLVVPCDWARGQPPPQAQEQALGDDRRGQQVLASAQRRRQVIGWWAVPRLC